MSTQEEREAEAKQNEDKAQARRAERDAEKKQMTERRRRYEAKSRRIKDIFWSAVIASVITLLIVTAFGWLTTQAVVEQAREEGAKELIALRASICLVRFEQRPDAEAKLEEFKALSWNERSDAVQEFITKEGLATMLGEDAPAQGAVEQCADAILRS